MFQQTPVTREQDALLFDGNPHQFHVVGMVAIIGVEPQHAQIARQPSQMDIQYKSRFPQRPLPDA